MCPKELGQASSFAQGLLAKNPIPQLNGMVPEVIRINLKIGGTFNKPTVNVGKPDGTAGGATMKDAVKAQAQEQIQQVKEQAKQTLDTIKTQVKEEVKTRVQEISLRKKSEWYYTEKSIQENAKDQLKDGFKWPRW